MLISVLMRLFLLLHVWLIDFYMNTYCLELQLLLQTWKSFKQRCVKVKFISTWTLNCHIFFETWFHCFLLMNLGDFARARDYTDPHVLTGVLTTSLQQIPDSLLSEVYDEVVSMDITEDYSQCRVLITSWLVKLSLKRFELVSNVNNRIIFQE